MQKIRVLVVDDSIVIRKLLTETLNNDASIEVVATAPNGRIALAKIEQLNPDLVTLDLDMPGLNGLDTLDQIRRVNPDLPVIVVSGLTTIGAEQTLEALAKGANDYVAKPSNLRAAPDTVNNFQSDIVASVKGLCKRLIRRHLSSSQNRGNVVASRDGLAGRPVKAKRERVDVVAIGVSTGGPNALARVLEGLPSDFPVPIVIVQHMPPVFTRHLANRLSQNCNIRVAEGAGSEIVTPGWAYIAPGDFHMTVRKRKSQVELVTYVGPPENSCRPAVDTLFRSIANVYGKNALAVVLTGMGQDGLRGSEEILDHGGTVIVQDEASSVVWGMPGAVAQAGLAEKIIPLAEIGQELIRLTRCGRTLNNEKELAS